MPSHQSPAARYETVTSASRDAPWITLVHGVSQDRRVFSRQVTEFKANYRLILIDLPGHGLSSDLPGPYGLEEFASSILGALYSAGVDRSHFWGTHLGAGAGLLLACQQPESFQSLVLEGPVFPGRPLPAVSEMLASIAITARESGVNAARDKWWLEAGWFAVMRSRPEECHAAEHRAIIDEFEGKPWLDAGLASRPIATLDEALRQLRAPVLIMNGEHDMPSFVEAANALESILPKCRRVIVKDGGGFPLWEFPNRVNVEVRRFLKGI